MKIANQSNNLAYTSLFKRNSRQRSLTDDQIARLTTYTPGRSYELGEKLNPGILTGINDESFNNVCSSLLDSGISSKGEVFVKTRAIQRIAQSIDPVAPVRASRLKDVAIDLNLRFMETQGSSGNTGHAQQQPDSRAAQIAQLLNNDLIVRNQSPLFSKIGNQ